MIIYVLLHDACLSQIVQKAEEVEGNTVEEMEDLGGLFRKASEKPNSERSHQMAANTLDCSLFPVYETHAWEVDELTIITK